MSDNEAPAKYVSPIAPGKKFKDMTPQEKVVYLLRCGVCILTFGMVFPNAFG